MFTRTLLSGALLALALSTPAAADPPAAAVSLYASGQYLAAADSAEAHSNPASLAFASRALMAACVTATDPGRIGAWLDQAESNARDALRLDAESVDARVQLALIYGVRGRRASVAQAIARHYAPRGRRLLEEALAREPDNAWAHALLGAWHLEVLRRGGAAGAAVYGARLSSGIAEFERARALAPNDSMIALHYAVALIELDPEAHAQRAGGLLAEVANTAPRDAFEAHAQRAARRVARALDEDGPEAAELAARDAFL